MSPDRPLHLRFLLSLSSHLPSLLFLPLRRNSYIGQVDYSTTPQQLGEYFKSAGAVARVTIAGYPYQPQGYAYLEFETQEGQQAAIETLDSTDFNGRTLKVGHREREDNSCEMNRVGGLY